jgi:hypothetical protein
MVKNMNKNNILLMGIILIGSILLACLPSAATTLDEPNISNNTYDKALIIIDAPSIEGIPDNDHIGGLHDLDLTLTGPINGIILTQPVWGTAIINNSPDITMHMDHYLGITVSGSNHGNMVGICQGFSWELA